MEICRPESLQVLLCYQLSHFSSALTHRHTGCFQTNHSIWPPSSSQRTSAASLMRLLSFNCPIDTLLPFRPIPGTEGLSLSVLRRHSSPDLWTLTPLAYLPPGTSSSTLTSVPKSSSVCLLAYRTRVLSVMTSPSSLLHIEFTIYHKPLPAWLSPTRFLMAAFPHSHLVTTEG